MEIKPITLKIERGLWEKFKLKVPRTISLNDKLVFLIERFVNEKSKSS